VGEWELWEGDFPAIKAKRRVREMWGKPEGHAKTPVRKKGKRLNASQASQEGAKIAEP